MTCQGRLYNAQCRRPAMRHEGLRDRYRSHKGEGQVATTVCHIRQDLARIPNRAETSEELLKQPYNGLFEQKILVPKSIGSLLPKIERREWMNIKPEDFASRSLIFH